MTTPDKQNSKIVEVASAVLSGAMPVLEGIRCICELRYNLDDPDNEAFLVLRAVESETDEYPIGSVRLNYDEAYLHKMDMELERYIESMHADIMKACRDIVYVYSK